MGFKKAILVLLLLIILTMGAVSAADNQTSDNLTFSEDSHLESSTEDITLTQNENNNNLTATPGTLTELREEIDAAAGSKLKLTRDYEYSGSEYINVSVNYAMTIDGQGHTIDCKKARNLFLVYDDNVVLKNIKFANCKSDGFDGSAIHWYGNAGILENCSFENCTSAMDTSENAPNGGAIYWYGNNGRISNCSFEKCSAILLGGAIYWRGLNGSISDCSFVKCSSVSSIETYTAGLASDGGAVYWAGINGTLSNCSFKECSASKGDAIYWNGLNGTATGCSIVKFSTDEYGAVYWSGNNGDLTNCSFVNCSSTAYYGGVLYWTGVNGSIADCGFDSITGCAVHLFADNGNVCGSDFKNLTKSGIHVEGVNGAVINCSFENCSTSGSGSAIDWRGINGSLINCGFINCSSNNLGGAVLWASEGGAILNSTFKDCFAFSIYGSGGAIKLTGSNCNVSECNFEGCHADGDGGAIYLTGNDCNVFGCNFEGCDADSQGGAICWEGSNGTVSNCSFENCSAGSTTGAIIWLNGNSKGQIEYSNFTNCYAPNTKAIYTSNEKVGIYSCIFEDNTTNDLNDLVSVSNITQCILNGNPIKKDLVMNLTASEIIYGEEEIVIVSLPADATGNVTLSLADMIVTKFPVDGIINYNFPNLDAGAYAVTATYSGDDNYYPSNRTVNFIVNRKPSILSIVTTYDEYLTLLVNLTAGYGNVTININNESFFTIEITNGTYVLNVANMTPGSYYFTAEFLGNDNYEAAYVDTILTINATDTFKNLQDLIDAAGDELNLTSNFTYADGDTSVTINKPITINGNGHTLDAKGLSRIFNINAANVVLNNITLINGHHDTLGGAIYWNAANGTLYNSIFLNCTSNKGGAIQWTGTKGTIIGCNFENNTADTGGAIYWYYADDGIIVNSSFYNSNACAIDLTSSNNCRVTNCNFVRNIAYQRGGSIHWYGSDNGSVSYCNFIESHDIYGGAVFWHYSNDGSISNCNFEKNTASNGGAIRTYACHILVSNSKFVENSATLTGGAIDADCSVYNCTFINNTADCGGAIEEGGSKCSISDCTFIGNNANSGGTIRSSDCSITNCTFEKNTANYGGAIHGGNRNIINNCTFTDCSSNKKGGAIYLMLSDNIVTNCTFINCSSTEEGGAIELYGENNKVDNSIFIKSKGSSAKAIHVNGNNSTISNSNFEDEKVKSIYELINQGKIINCTLNGNKTIIAKINIINSINEYLNGNFSFQLIDFYTDEPIAGVVLQLMTTGNIRAGFSATTDADGIATFKTKNLYEFSQNTTTFEMKKLEVGNHTVELKTSENVESASTYANLTIIKANINLATVIDGINATVTATNKKNEEAVPEIVLHISYDNQDSYLSTDVNGTVKFIANLPCGTHTITVSTNDTKNINYTETNITINVPYKTFQDLSLLIANASEGSILELSDDYIYGNGTTEGIQITKAITIDGKGHTLDALFKSRIFNIAADGVVLKNIVFNNGRPYDDGGAISCECNNLTIVNCTFDNNAASYFAGAVDCTGDNLTILYSTFTNNEANGDGGAVRSTGDNCMISDCTFISNSAVGDGGAVLTNGENCIISNSKFNNNVAVIYNGGAVRNTGDYCIIRNSTFIGNRASSHYGGAIKSGGANPIISNSVFIDNHAIEGGAFFVSVGFYSTVINSSFINNTADDKGGAINFDILGNVTGCTFSGNSDPEIYSNNNTLNINSTFTELKSLIDSANSGDTIDLSGYYYGSGSSISIDKTITLRGNGETVLDAKGLSSILSVSANNVRIENIKFVNGQNSGNWGGAIHWEGDSGVLINSTFVNNVASWGAGIFWWAQDGYMANCTFENNTAERYGGALYVNGEKLRMLNSLFKNNIVTESISSWEGGGAIYTDGNNHLVANSTFIDNKAINSWGGAIKHGSETASYQSNEFYNNTAIRGNSVWESDANNLVNNIFNLNSIDEIASCVEDANLSALFENNIFKVKGIVISKDDYFNETDTGSNESSQNITQSTFTDITNLISNAHAGDTINLEGTYYGTGSIITVNKELTIKGNGETILDAKNLSGILSVSADNVRINNIRFINGKINANGGAINWIGKNGTISNCTFINCSAENGGSVYWNGENGMINKSTFNHSTATQNGGAIYWNANSGEIANSIFTHSYAQNGGAVYVPENRNVEIKSSIFDNNMAEEESGAVYGGTIDDDCTFKSNTYTPLNTTTIVSINETAAYTGNDISITTIVLSQKGGFANTGTVEIYINSKLMATIPANTQYIHTTGEIGTYQVLAKFIDDSSYKNSSSTAEFTVIPVDIPEEIETSTAGIFTLEFPDDAEGTLTVFIDGTKYKVYDIIGGILKIDLSDKKGKYNITFEYSGDKNYPAFKKDANITVETNPSITASNAKVLYSAGTTYKITVYKNKGITANSVSVVIKQNNKKFKTIKTNSKGIASFKVTQTPGTYKLKITSLGKTVTKTLTVKHIVTLKTVTVKKSAKKLILQATLAKVNKKYLKKKTVTFKFNGKKYKAKTNSKGVAKVTIKSNVLKKLKVGKKLTYQATYLKDTVKKTTKVKK